MTQVVSQGSATSSRRLLRMQGGPKERHARRPGQGGAALGEDRQAAGWLLPCTANEATPPGKHPIQVLASCHVLHTTSARTQSIVFVSQIAFASANGGVSIPITCMHYTQAGTSTIATAASAAAPSNNATIQQTAKNRWQPTLGLHAKAKAGAEAAQQKAPEAQPACCPRAPAAFGPPAAPAPAGAPAAQPASLQQRQEALLGRLVAEAAEAQCAADELAAQVQALEQANK